MTSTGLGLSKLNLLNAGDLDYLEQLDVLKLKLPNLAEEVMLQCIKQGVCRPPLALDFIDATKTLQMPIQVGGADHRLYMMALLLPDWNFCLNTLGGTCRTF